MASRSASTSSAPEPAPRAQRTNDPAARLLDMIEAHGGSVELLQAAEAVCADQRLVERELDRLTQRNVELTLALDSARVATWIWRTRNARPELESEHGIAAVSGLSGWDGRFDSFLAAVAEEDREGVGNALRSGTTRELHFQLRGRDGELRWLLARCRPWPPEAMDPLFIAGTLTDVSARKELEARLRDAEAKYRMLVEELPAIVYIVTLDRQGNGQTTYISPKVQPILGYTPDEWLADPHLWWKIVEDDYREAVKREIDRKDQDDGSPQRITQVYPVRHKDGHRVWLRNESTTVWDPARRVRYTDGVMIDITVRADQASGPSHTPS